MNTVMNTVMNTIMNTVMNTVMNTIMNIVMLTVMNTIMNYVMNTVMSMCPVTNSVLKPVMNRESYLLTPSGLVLLIRELHHRYHDVFFSC